MPTHQTFREIDCMDDEEYQTFLPTMTGSGDCDTWPCGIQEYNALTIFPQHSINPAFTQSPHGSETFTYRGAAALPPTPHQITRLTYPIFPTALMAPQFFPQNRLSMQQYQPFYGTSEPRMMFSQNLDYTMARSVPWEGEYEVPTPVYSPDTISPTATSPSLSFMSSPEQYYPYPASAWVPEPPDTVQAEMMVNSGNHVEEEEGNFDKPYAQLIYDALSQAPGHRMLLRDIYEWFVQNTRKPRESGTNGWQNSIRHNLSMNQAFENDKNDPAASRGARKANSVWVLTEQALRHGVQSTTRFRKNNSSKKGVGNRTPAVKRQRSGARGGRAARRAAQSKRADEMREASYMRAEHRPSLASIPINVVNNNTTGRQEQANFFYSPATPHTGHFFDSSSDLSHEMHYPSKELDCQHEAEQYSDEDDQLRKILTQTGSEDDFGDMRSQWREGSRE